MPAILLRVADNNGQRYCLHIYTRQDSARSQRHPQTNDLTERLNKIIEDMLSMYTDMDHKNWDDILPCVTFTYNTAQQETTQKMPFSLLHGHEVTTMLDAMQ